MEYRIITVVFTKRKLSPLEMTGLKRYKFVCEAQVKIGDLIDSPVYSTTCQVVDVRYEDHIPTTPNGYFLKTISVDSINGQSPNQNHKKMKEKNEQVNADNMFDDLFDSYMSQYMPVNEPEVRMSMNGLLCVPQGDKYVAIDANNKLISFIPSMTISGFPVISIERPISQILPGDIIKRNRSYAKVIENTGEGLKILSFSGVATKQAAITDMLLGQATFRVLINFFSPNSGMGNINPIMFLAMSKQGNNNEGIFKMVAMSQMLQGGMGNMFGNMFQQPNGQPSANQPAAQPIFPMFQQPAVQPTAQPSAQPAEQPVSQPAPPSTLDDAIKAILSDPETRKKVEEALKK